MKSICRSLIVTFEKIRKRPPRWVSSSDNVFKAAASDPKTGPLVYIWLVGCILSPDLRALKQLSAYLREQWLTIRQLSIFSDRDTRKKSRNLRSPTGVSFPQTSRQESANDERVNETRRGQPPSVHRTNDGHPSRPAP